MKKYFGMLLIAIAVVFSSVAVYGADSPKEIIVQGIVPKEWGTLRYVEPFKPGDQYHKRLYFEDSEGTIRTVGLFLYKNGYKVGEKAIVIKRAK